LFSSPSFGGGGVGGEGSFLIPIPLLNPPPSLWEGGGNYCMYFLPLLWRGKLPFNFLL